MNKDIILNTPKNRSESQAWIEWHKAMKSRLGKKTANAIFVKFWQQRAGKGSEASTVELRNYMEKQGVKLDTTAMEDFADISDSVTSGIGGFFSFAKYTGIALGVIIIGGLAMVVYNIGKEPVKAVNTAMKVKTGGR